MMKSSSSSAVAAPSSSFPNLRRKATTATTTATTNDDYTDDQSNNDDDDENNNNNKYMNNDDDDDDNDDNDDNNSNNNNGIVNTTTNNNNSSSMIGSGFHNSFTTSTVKFAKSFFRKSPTPTTATATTATATTAPSTTTTSPSAIKPPPSKVVVQEDDNNNKPSKNNSFGGGDVTTITTTASSSSPTASPLPPPLQQQQLQQLPQSGFIPKLTNNNNNNEDDNKNNNASRKDANNCNDDNNLGEQHQQRQVTTTLMLQSSNGSINNNSVGRTNSSTMTSSTTTTTNKIRPTFRLLSRNSNNRMIETWHQDIAYAIVSGKWDTIRGHLSLMQGSTSRSTVSSCSSDDSDDHDDVNYNNNKGSSSFWSRLSGGGGGGTNNNKNSNSEENHTIVDKTGLLCCDNETVQNTPLHSILMSRKVPSDIIIKMIDIEPRAVSKKNSKLRYPLHFAIVHKHTIEIISKIIDAYPAAISAQDVKGLSPLHYAIDIAKKSTNLYTTTAGKKNNNNNSHNHHHHHNHTVSQTYWMPVPDDCNEAQWQNEQSEKWGTVHWLLLSSATHPQSGLSVLCSRKNNSNKQQPMLVDALYYAASPPVISLLIGASVMLLNYENKATAFAGSTLYTCIMRHYPLTILMSLINQCSKDICKVQDETGMGLISAQYIAGCFQQQPTQQQQQQQQQSSLQKNATTSSTTTTNNNSAEWIVREDFYACFLECIQKKSIIDHDPALSDWWEKIKFLIAFCAPSTTASTNTGTGSNNKGYTATTTVPKEYLLHAALINTDVPPQVIRMLLSVSPESIHLRWNPTTKSSNNKSNNNNNKTKPKTITNNNSTNNNSSSTSNNNNNNIDAGYNVDSDSDSNDKVARSGALPLHLAAMTKEYIPRYYEKVIADRENVLETIFKADKSAVHKRYERRLPLHYAIGCGKLLSSFNALLEIEAKQQLLQRDPKTKLYPFLLVACYNNKTDVDSFRWSCTARNSYPNTEWKNMNDRQKAVAILKIAELEELGRIETCYQLLKQQPMALYYCCNNHSSIKEKRKTGTESQNDTNSNKIWDRDVTGMGTVAGHYIDWCYSKNVDANVTNQETDFISNQMNQEIYKIALDVAERRGTLASLPSSFDEWWTQLLFWIKRCCPTELTYYHLNNNNNENENTNVEHGQQQYKVDRTMVDRDERYILHAAVANSDTPPAVIALLTYIYPQSAALPLPNTSSFLPLHIASQVTSYTPRPFEKNSTTNINNINRVTTLGLILKSSPAAIRTCCNGLLPLHIAIFAAKPLDEIQMLVNEEPRALTIPEPETRLYPFQLMALRYQIYSPEQRVRFQHIARNKYVNEKIWSALTPQEQTKQFQKVQRDHQLNILSCVYMLLRTNPLILGKHIPAKDESNVNISQNGWQQNNASMNGDFAACEESFCGHVSLTMKLANDQDVTELDDTEVSASRGTLYGATRGYLTTNPMQQSQTVPDSLMGSETSSTFAAASYGISPMSATAKTDSDTKPSALMLFMTQNNNKNARKHTNNEDMYECDASVFSSVDVMSTFSSVSKTNKKKKKKKEIVNDDNDEGSIRLEMLNMPYEDGNRDDDDDDDDGDSDDDDEEEEDDDESCMYDDFAEESCVASILSKREVTSKALDSSKDNHKKNDNNMNNDGLKYGSNATSDCEGDGASNDEDDEDDMVVFEIRRIPRLFYRTENNHNASAINVKLTRKANNSSDNLPAFDKPKITLGDDSVDPREFSGDLSKTTDHDIETRSYVSLQPNELNKIVDPSADTMWMSSQFVETALNANIEDESSVTMETFSQIKETQAGTALQNRTKSGASSAGKSKKTNHDEKNNKSPSKSISKKNVSTLESALGALQDSYHYDDDDALLIDQSDQVPMSPLTYCCTIATKESSSGGSHPSPDESKKSSTTAERMKNLLGVMTQDSSDRSMDDVLFGVKDESNSVESPQCKERTQSPTSLAKQIGETGTSSASLEGVLKQLRTDKTVLEALFMNASNEEEIQPPKDVSPQDSVESPQCKERTHSSTLLTKHTGETGASFSSLEGALKPLRTDKTALEAVSMNASNEEKVEDALPQDSVESPQCKERTHSPTSLANQIGETGGSSSSLEGLLKPLRTANTVLEPLSVNAYNEEKMLSPEDSSPQDSYPAVIVHTDSLSRNHQIELAPLTSISEGQVLDTENVSFTSRSTLKENNQEVSEDDANKNSEGNIEHSIGPSDNRVSLNDDVVFDTNILRQAESIKKDNENFNISFDKVAFRWVKRMVVSNETVTSGIASSSSNRASEAGEEIHISFDKVAFRWVKRKVASDISEPMLSNKSNNVNIVSNTHVQHKDWPALKTEMYYDKKSMRWRRRMDPSSSYHKPNEPSLVKDEQEIRTIKAGRVNWTDKQSLRHDAIRRSTPLLFGYPLPSESLLCDWPRNENKRRNEAFFAVARHGVTSTVFEGSRDPSGRKPDHRFGAKSSAPVKTPNDRELRSQWAAMFNSHSRLCCLECKSNDKEVLMLPCRHLCLCRNCYETHQNLSECPMCGDTVTDKIFMC